MLSTTQNNCLRVFEILLKIKKKAHVDQLAMCMCVCFVLFCFVLLCFVLFCFVFGFVCFVWYSSVMFPDFHHLHDVKYALKIQLPPATSLPPLNFVGSQWAQPLAQGLAVCNPSCWRIGVSTSTVRRPIPYKFRAVRSEWRRELVNWHVHPICGTNLERESQIPCNERIHEISRQPIAMRFSDSEMQKCFVKIRGFRLPRPSNHAIWWWNSHLVWSKVYPKKNQT